MGKWATYKKRGSHSGALALPAPPIPSLDDEDGDLISYVNGEENVGGTLILQRETAPGTWTLIDLKPYNYPLVFWGLVINFAADDYRAVQVGNGTDFAGSSEPSDVLSL